MTTRRSGKSLLELTMIMGLMSTVLILGGRTFGYLMRSDARARKSVVETSGFCRLADRFRRDVRAAESAEVVPGPKPGTRQLRLTLPGGDRVLYRPHAGYVSVVRVDGERTLGRERFEVGPGATTVELVDAPVELAVLIHAPMPPESERMPAQASPRRFVRIEAARGRDLRFRAASGKPNPANAKRPRSTLSGPQSAPGGPSQP